MIRWHHKRGAQNIAIEQLISYRCFDVWTIGIPIKLLRYYRMYYTVLYAMDCLLKSMYVRNHNLSHKWRVHFG